MLRPIPSLTHLLVLLTTLGVWAGDAAAAAATRVPLVIDEPTPRTVAWPVTTGVPFPRGAVKELQQVRLVDDTGRECPLQAKVSATWEPPAQADSSVRWMTIDFIAQPQRRYTLEFGPDVRRQQSGSPLHVESREGAVVETGVLRVEISKGAPAALASVHADLDGNGTYAANEQLLTAAAEGDHFYVDQDQARATAAGDGADREVVVESDGPVRACVRVDGFYTDAHGHRIVKYRTRYHLFAGLGLIKIVDEFGIVGSTKGMRFSEIGLQLQIAPAARPHTVRFAPLDDPSRPPVSVAWRSNTVSLSSFQEDYRHWGNPLCRAGISEWRANNATMLDQGDRAGGWVQLVSDKASITGSLPWFWQQFPKEWRVGADRLTLDLWSPRGGALDFSADGFRAFAGPAGQRYFFEDRMAKSNVPPTRLKWGGLDAILRGDGDGHGINKHHEIWFHLAPVAQAEQAAEYGRLAERPPVALASGEWNVSTDVFGPLAARPNDSPYEAIIDRYLSLFRQVQDDFGDYGWWAFGSGPHYSYKWDEQAGRFYAEPLRFEYHTYGRETQMWWSYLRSGERAVLDWCLPSENAWVDVAVAHVPLKAYAISNGTRPGDRTVDWRPGDWSIDGPMHYLRQHDDAERWLTSGAQFWATYHRTLETTTLAYYLTGDERFRDVIEYWRAYFKDLAGKTSASTDAQPWHRAEAWWEPTGPETKRRTWAEMHRDWAPFASGSRHKMTLLFNLATLYEATWDPAIGQVLKEYADANIDLNHPAGMWQVQESRGPQFAAVPMHPHFAVPAMWKYARVTRDPRMPEVFARFLDVCYRADPFESDLGEYSRVQVAYAYYLTRDPKWLPLGLRQLEELMPLSTPLGKPQEVNERLYNPAAPIEAMTLVPREIWALQEASRRGIKVSPAPTNPQRAPMSFTKSAAGVPVTLVIWGFDPAPRVVGPDGRSVEVSFRDRQECQTRIEPFDRVPAGYQAVMQTLELPADLPAGRYLLLPRLETGIVSVDGGGSVAVNAAWPLRLNERQAVQIRVQGASAPFVVETAAPASLKPTDEQGNPLATTVTGNRVEVAANDVNGGRTIVLVAERPLYFRIVDRPESECWVGASAPDPFDASAQQPWIARPAEPEIPTELFTAGRFGQAVWIVPGRSMKLKLDPARPLDPRQGTVECFVKRAWDGRTRPFKGATFLMNKALRLSSSWERMWPNGRGGKLPVDEWTHVALVWRPAKQDPTKNLFHLYVNGTDQGMYRSIWWPGYPDGEGLLRPPPSMEELMQDFTSEVTDGGAFAIDELRLSNVARYADRDVELGWQQLQNPLTIQPPTEPFAKDEHTVMLLRFDSTLNDEMAGKAAAEVTP